MSDQPDSRECPRCGGGMLFRLNEYECTSCGHFIRHEGTAAATAVAPAIAETIRRAAKEQPLARPAPKSSLVTYDPAQRKTRLFNWLKITYLVVIVVETVGIGLLVQSNTPDAVIDAAFIRGLIVGAILLSGFAALTLYVDWRGFKIMVLVLTIIIIAAYLVEFAKVWSGQEQLPVVRLTADVLMLGWFAILNLQDIMKKV